MGIKKLFETTDTSRNYLAETTEKDAFQDVESAANLRAINKDKQRFVPQINYSRPKNFARFGSAYLYYKSSIERVLDYYPYDGSDAEINEYFNDSLDIDRYILRHLYPRSTGYALLSADGWGSLSTLDSGSGYGLPSSLEYITFYGGPGTGSANLSGSSLVNLGPNDSNSKFQYSNIYEASSSTSNLYSRAGLPLDYGKGSRESNLKSNFDNGVTIEFWLKKDGFDNDMTSKEVVFDMWNTNETGSDGGDGAAYGRITIELTGATTSEGNNSPFLLTCQSGTTGIFTASIGQNLTRASLASWHHYGIAFFNSGSGFHTELYVDGKLNQEIITGERAVATITFAGVPTADESITIASTDGTYRIYTAKADPGVEALASPLFFSIGGTNAERAESLKGAIEGAFGHDGTILVSRSGAVLTLIQSTPGTAGNTDITEDLTNVTKTNFVGGTLTTNLDEIPSKNMVGSIGGLLTNISGGAYTTPGSFTATSGSGKLSGSLDEFRFWKVRRTAKEIGEHWFSQVRGGVNTDISNTTLGMYYKFNEGITGNPAVDSIVLDYGGRVCNGGWVGYDASSRNTGSAILSASAAIKEYNDPIVRPTNLKVIDLKSGLLATGSAHDSTNNASILSLTPEWVIEDHGDDEVNNLNIISHIIGSYFDTLYQQIEAVPTLNQANYPSASYKPMPFAEHLPQSLGLYTPELFVDATVMEKFLNRDKERLFSGDLTETKNLIYTNLYNNLTSIYKSKGTEKAIRNVMRCFSVDERFMRLGVYADRQVYELKDNLRQTLVNRKSLNFNTTNNLGGVVYQRLSSSNVNSLGYLSGTYSSSGPEVRYGCTIEADITFPRYNTEREIFERNFAKASLFGGYSVFTASATSLAGSDLAFITGSQDLFNFQVLAIKSQESAKNVSFILTSSNDPHPLPTLTSSQFLNVYDETEWNFSVRVNPSIGAFAEALTGAVRQDGATYNYDVVFRGTNTQLGSILETFEVTGTMSQAAGANFLSGSKRLYAGARRTNITGTLLNKSDVLFNGLRYWAKYLDNGTLDQHAYDLDNMGISASYQHLSALDSGSQGYDILNNKTLLLNWNFESVTGSGVAGEFSQIIDISSGSSEIRNNFGWLGKQAGYQHTGYGYGFAASSTDVVRRQAINAFRFIDPEQVNASDMVQILSDDDKTFGTTDTYMAPDYYYTLEKSLYNAISEEMLDFFAGVVDFNNVIGAPVNRYRERYKDLEKLREVFFRKVTTIAEVERFIGYYKWFDDAIAQIVDQLMPASSDFKADVMNVVESHVLERNKYQTKYPTLEFKIPTLDDALKGIEAASYDYHQGSSVEPGSPRNTKLRYKFWHERAKRTAPEISSSYPAVDTQREIYRKVINSAPRLTQSLNIAWTQDNTSYDLDPYAARNFGKTQQLKVDPPVGRHRVIKGGVNFAHGKNIMYVYNALYPFGPINTDGGRFIPLNVLFTPAEDLVHNVKFKMLDSNPTGKKRQRVVKVQHGRDWEGGLGYKNVKSTYGYPFNLVSGNVTTGYNAAISTGFMTGVILTNLHNDVYGPDMEVPMQGPFTDYAVGGHQSRHVRVNTGSDTYLNRPEAWKFAPGVCETTNSGAIGMVSVDYPYPDLGKEGSNAVGQIDVSGHPGVGSTVTINDGETETTFEVEFTNTKATNFPTSDCPSIQVGGLAAPNADEIYELDQWTISGWIRLDPAGGGSRTIFQAGATGQTRNFLVRSNAKLRYSCEWSDTVAGGGSHEHYWEATTALSDSTWYHVALVYDGTTGSSDPVFYIDGAVDAISAEYSPAPSGSLVAFDAGAIARVGGSQGQCGTLRFEGDLDEVSIWQLTMSADQVTELYASGSALNLFKHSLYTGDSANLYSWWRMGDDPRDAIDGTGTYVAGTNSIIDQTGRANGNPWDAVTTTFDTDVASVYQSVAPGNVGWTQAYTSADAAENLLTAVNNQSAFGISATGRSGGAFVVTNTKFGTATSTRNKLRGAQGNIAISSTKLGPAAAATAYGLSGGTDPQIMNFNAPRATYYRDMIAKAPVNIKNIQLRSGSTILGNYRQNYEVVSTVGAFSNPRRFVKNPISMPATITDRPLLSASDVVRTYLNLHRGSSSDPGIFTGSHFNYELEYAPIVNTGSDNQSIIISRFGAPGGVETMTRGYQDFRASEFSVYNTLNNRNLPVIRPSQGPSDTVSETTGIRVSDINSEDYGLYSHAARHAARFGRDSLAVADYDLNSTLYMIGESSMHAYTSNSSLQAWWRLNTDVSTHGDVADSSGNGRAGTFDAAGDRPGISRETPGNKIQVSTCEFDGTDDQVNVGTAATWQAIIGTGGTSKMTFSTWINFSFISGYDNIFWFGESPNGHAVLYYTNSSDRWTFRTSWGGSNFSWQADHALTVDTWYHLAVTYNAGATGNDPVLYINGVAVSWASEPTVTGVWGGIQTDACYIGASPDAAYPFTGYLADFAVWDSILTADEMKALYNATKGAFLNLNPAGNFPGASLNQRAAMFKVNRNPAGRVKTFLSHSGIEIFEQSAQYDNFNVQHTIPRMDKQYAWVTSSIVLGDDFTEVDYRYYGRAQTWGALAGLYQALGPDGEPLYSTFFDYVMESNVSTDYDPQSPSGENVVNGGFAQGARMNTYTIDPINSGSTNLLGFNATSSGDSYISATPMTVLGGVNVITQSTTSDWGIIPQISSSATYLNLLLTRRRATYGWTWLATRQQQHPILLKERDNQKISVVTSSNDSIMTYRLAPLSNRGRPVIMNFDVAGTNNTTIKITHNNEQLWFNDPNLDNVADFDPEETITAYEQLLGIIRAPSSPYNLNWVAYSENLFPSLRNEFSGGIISKPTYNNKYWRDSKANRVTEGNTIANSYGIRVSQSAWPLDPPEDFLTRTVLPSGTFNGPGNDSMWDEDGAGVLGGYDYPADWTSAGGEGVEPWANNNVLKFNPKSGELQNGYVMANLSSSWGGTGYGFFHQAATTGKFLDPSYGVSALRYLFPGALYARKHMLSSPSSLVSPTGVRIAETGSLPRTGSWEMSSSFEAGAGEAVWEAGQQAGIIVQTPEVYSLTASFTAPNTASYAVSTYTGVSSLQGWWRLNADVSTEGDVADSSGKGRTGTFGGSSNRPIFSTDNPSTIIQQNSCLFDGTNDQIKIGSAATWDAIIGKTTVGGTAQMTLAGWVNLNAHGGAAEQFIDFGNDNAIFFRNAAGRLGFQTEWNSGAQAWWLGTDLDDYDGTWIHVAVTYDATSPDNNPQLYLNGLPDTTSGPTGTGPTNTWDGITISECYLGGSGGDVDGLMADWAVWNSILSADEIKAIANARNNPNLGSPSQFQLSASAPWFDQYSDYNYEMKLLAKDYSIVPEFRISDHVEDYLKYGLFNPNKFDWCTIPETGINSSTSSFYLDYSNSEFMHDFLRVKNETLLNAKEIKLVCSAAIRFNPYKGFYPVQRTLQMVGAFSSSYMHGFTGRHAWSDSTGAPGPSQLLENSASMLRPGVIPFHSPGILYNSIKSGIAVDYPIITTPERAIRTWVYQDDQPAGDPTGPSSASVEGAGRSGFSNNLYAVTCPGTGTVHSSFTTPLTPDSWRGTGSWFNERLPFEAAITPEIYLDNKTFVDLESHTSGAVLVSASWNGAAAAPTTYTRMARNFFGEVGNFFLKDAGFTKLKSAALPSDIQFDSGSVYGARLKIRRSVTGSRTYEYDGATAPQFTRLDTGSHYYFAAGVTSSFGMYGGRGLFSASVGSSGVQPGANCQWMTGTFPLPQDPHSNPSFKETFTMYSRPSAFGPDIAGRPMMNQGTVRSVLGSLPSVCRGWPSAIGNKGILLGAEVKKGDGYVATNYPYDSSSYYARHMATHSGVMDCFNGFNWAYTPPYYHGESWADFVFRPTTGKSYDLDTILAETKIRYWRADPGWAGNSGSNFGQRGIICLNGKTPLIPSFNHGTGALTFAPYDGAAINQNAMQLSASVDLFGIETVPLIELDIHGKPVFTRNEVQGKRWVIQPKFETPMLNFNDEGIHPITKLNGNLTLPANFSASVPRGMWHQFGTIPEDPDKGVFLEMGDIPTQWLQYHYECINTGSMYNDGNIASGQRLHEEMRSLSDVVGFNSNTPSARLGELADSRTIREAVVAIPYIIENVEVTDPATLEANWTSLSRKKFIEIPAERYAAASAATDGSETGDSLAAAGESIRKLIQKMGRYILPPQFDFINNESITPMVMYMFEFEYTFDKDDLSYMWQNLAPRDSKEIKLEYKSVAHELMDTELLNESIIMDNANLRWMVFKVKQKSQVDYYDLRVQQLGQIEAPDLTEESDSAYKIEYNWPYDFLSFVEMIKIDAEVLFTSDGAAETRQVLGEGEFSLPSNIVAPEIVAQVATTLQQGPLTPDSIGETIIEAVSNIPLQQGNLVRQKAVTRQPRRRRPGVLKKAKTGPYSKKKTGSKTSTKKSSKNKKK